MKRALIALASSALLLAAAAAAAGLPPQYAGTPTVKDFPAADVLVLSETKSFTLAPDGRVTEKVRLVQKMLTYEGMDHEGDPLIAFNKENQDLAITLCRTHTPEGRTVDAKANSFNEMTPFALEKAPAYTSWRQMVVSKVGLDVNAVTELEYTIADKKPWRRHLEGVEVLQDGDPALLRQISVTAPEKTDLHWAVFNASAQPETSTEGGQRTLTWTFKNLPLVHLAAVSEDEKAFLPTLVFTTCADWGRQTEAVGALAEKAISASSPALDKKTDDLVAGLASPFDKALKLHAYVAESINTIEWPLEDFDFSPRSAASVYDSGYGHALDKAVLLCAMLKRAGIEAAIAAVRRVPEDLTDPTTVPCLAQMRGIIIHSDPGGSTLWLDPSAPLAEKSQRDFQGFKGLPLLKGYSDIHTMPALGTPDQLNVMLDGKLAADLSCEGKATVSLSGEYGPYFKARGSADAQKDLLTALLGALLPGASVTELSVDHMDLGSVAFTAKFKAPAPGPSTLKILKTGLPEGSLLKAFPGSYLSARDLPLLLHHGGKEIVSLKLALPEGLKAASLPKAINESNAAGSFSQTATVKDGALLVDYTATIPKVLVPVKDYGAFRSLYGLANAQANRTVVFE